MMAAAKARPRVMAVVLGFVLAMVAGGASAEMYRWKDESGNWQFSDKAPESPGTSAESVELKQKEVTEEERQAARETHERIKQTGDALQKERRLEELAERDEEIKKRKLQPKAKKGCRLEWQPIYRGMAGGGTRVVGGKYVERCDK